MKAIKGEKHSSTQTDKNNKYTEAKNAKINYENIN